MTQNNHRASGRVVNLGNTPPYFTLPRKASEVMPGKSGVGLHRMPPVVDEAWLKFPHDSLDQPQVTGVPER